MEELSQALDEKPSFTDLNLTLREYASKNDLNDLLAMTETNRHLTHSVEQKENMELTILRTRMDEFQKEITKKVSACATLSELNDITNAL